MNLVEFISKQLKRVLYPICIVFFITTGIVDYLVGTDVSLLIFYFIPVLVAAWLMGKREGFIMSFIGAAIWLIVRLFHPDSSPLYITLWNALVRLAIFMMFVYFLYMMREIAIKLDWEKMSARTDPLTGIINNRGFGELADIEIKRLQRYKRPFTIVYMDIDNFKAVNDTSGHSAGDNLLRSVAQSMVKKVRGSDIVARLGGDEFIILLQETDQRLAEVTVNKIRHTLLELAERNRWPVTFSFGAVTFTNPPSSVDEMVEKADKLMYSAKSSSKNSIKYGVEYTIQLNTKIL